MEYVKMIVAVLFVLSTFAIGGSFIYQGLCMVTPLKLVSMVQDISLLAYVLSFVLTQIVFK